MKPRSHSLNQAVCVTMTVVAAKPTISVQRNATTWTNLRATVMSSLECLADAEVNAPVARFRFAVHFQVRDAVQLISEVDARRTDRRQISEAGPCRVHERCRDSERSVRHVAEVEERDASELTDERLADFCRPLQHGQPADRQSEAAQRIDFEPPPA